MGKSISEKRGDKAETINDASSGFLSGIFWTLPTARNQNNHPKTMTLSQSKSYLCCLVCNNLVVTTLRKRSYEGFVMRCKFLFLWYIFPCNSLLSLPIQIGQWPSENHPLWLVWLWQLTYLFCPRSSLWKMAFYVGNHDSNTTGRLSVKFAVTFIDGKCFCENLVHS